MAEPPRILFAVTSNGNLGDLALCADWVAALAPHGVRCAFALPASLQPYLPADAAAHFLYEPKRDVFDTIWDAAESFGAQLIILATGCFWSIPGQRGAQWGRWPQWPSAAGRVVAAFDPFERAFTCHVALTHDAITFPAVPEHIVPLRYMSMPDARGDRSQHFRLALPARARAAVDKAALRRAYALDPDRPLLLYCVSQNRLAATAAFFFDYYEHLARLLRPVLEDGAQLLVLGTERLPALAALPHTRLAPACQVDAFFAVLGASDVFLTDSLVSSLAYACFAGVPSVLLENPYRSPDELPESVLAGLAPSPPRLRQARICHHVLRVARALRLYRGLVPGQHSIATHGVFPWVVFPFGLTELREQAERTFAMAPCYRSAPAWDVDAAREVLNHALYDGPVRTAMLHDTRAWARIRMQHPAPLDTLRALCAAP